MKYPHTKIPVELPQTPTSQLNCPHTKIVLSHIESARSCCSGSGKDCDQVHSCPCFQKMTLWPRGGQAGRSVAESGEEESLLRRDDRTVPQTRQMSTRVGAACWGCDQACSSSGVAQHSLEDPFRRLFSLRSQQPQKLPCSAGFQAFSFTTSLIGSVISPTEVDAMTHRMQWVL